MQFAKSDPRIRKEPNHKTGWLVATPDKAHPQSAVSDAAGKRFQNHTSRQSSAARHRANAHAITAGLKNGGIAGTSGEHGLPCIHTHARTAQVYIGEHHPGKYKARRGA